MTTTLSPDQASKTTRVLIIEDDPSIAEAVQRIVAKQQGTGVIVGDGRNGLRSFFEDRPDLVVLDIGLPGMDGWEVLERIRDLSEVPVLILTAHDLEQEKVRGLTAGADDYLTKPFGGGELLARLRVLLRRVQPATELSVVRFGDIEVDFTKRTVTRAGADLHLTAKEYALLRELLQHRGKVVTHRQLLRDIWGPGHEEDTHYLRVHMANLRKKVEASAEQPVFLKTESGIGYRFVDTGDRIPETG